VKLSGGADIKTLTAFVGQSDVQTFRTVVVFSEDSQTVK